MKFCVLGNKAGGSPLLTRNHSATVLLLPGEVLLFDCGEGTQKRLLEAKISRSSIDRIFISHLHVDHVLGLIALLATFSSDKRTRPVYLTGPKGLRELLDCSFRAMDVFLRYDLEVRELDTHFSGRIVETESYTVDAQMLAHRVDSFGYRLDEKTHVNIDMDKARQCGLQEGAMIGHLKRVGQVQLDSGRVVTLHDVAAPPQKACSFVYCGDTEYSTRTVALARGAGVLLHEATFDASLGPKAGEWGHATASDAARVAKEAGVEKLYLTHISARYTDFSILLKEARAIFPATFIAEELQQEDVREKEEATK
jgi:ribonuclease Z